MPPYEPVAKILEIVPYPPPFTGWATRAYFVHKALQQMGHQCVVLNMGNNRKIPSNEYECVRSGWEYVRKILVYLSRGYTLHLHANGGSPKGFFLCLIAYFMTLSIFRRPQLTFHAGIEQIFFPRANSRKMVPILRLLFGIPKVVICNNSDVKARIVEYSINPTKVIAITPFSKQYVADATSEISTEIKDFIRNHSPIIFTYLELRPEHAPEPLFQGMASVAKVIPEIGFILVGATNEREALQRLLEQAGIAERTFHVGAVSHSLFLSLLRQSTVYLRSNQREGTSSSIRESLYLGTMVIANDKGDHPEGVITYPWGDGKAIGETLLGCLQNPRKLAAEAGDIPDTVGLEAELLARSALGQSWKELAFRDKYNIP